MRSTWPVAWGRRGVLAEARDGLLLKGGPNRKVTKVLS